MSSNVFVIWVPSADHEEQERLKSRSASIPEDKHSYKSNQAIDTTEEGSEENTTDRSSDLFKVTKVTDVPLINEPDLVANVTPDETVGENNNLLNELSTKNDIYSDVKLNHLKNQEHHMVDKTVESLSQVPFLEWEPIEVITLRFLAGKNINPLHVVQSCDGTHTQISFSVPLDQVELLLLELQSQGVGHTKGSSLTVLPASIHCSLTEKKQMEGEIERQDKMNKFYSSIKSRLLVSEVVARIQAGADFSFDFLVLLVLAGIIAFMGLLENSSVVLVASMLVSPLMGPILAGIFGGVIQDRKLAWRGVRHEVYALLICIVIGFLLGLLVCPLAKEYGIPQWPTNEMLSRGELRSLWVGILIAVPSGAGVALSVLGGNAGSLVGVAISASLLPPAVNAGIFWALSAVLAASGPDSHALFHGFGTEPGTNISLYETRYSSNLAMESFYLGLTSLALTLINIFCIILTGVFILKLKEVTPEKIPQSFSHFWRKDIKAHRNYHSKIRKEDNHKLLSEVGSSSLGSKLDQPEDLLAGSFLNLIYERAAQDEDLINIQKWVALPSTAHPPDISTPTMDIDDPAYDMLVSPSIQTPIHTVDTTTIASNNYFRLHSGKSQQANYLNTVHLENRRKRIWRLEEEGERNGIHQPSGTFLNVSDFLQQELRRSKEVRSQLYKNDTA